MNSLASLLNLGGPDLIVALVIVLLLFGAKKLPELGRRLGPTLQKSRRTDDEMADDPMAKEDDVAAAAPLPATELVFLALSVIALCSMLGVLSRGEVALWIGGTLLFWAALKHHGSS